jgi:Zn-dependent protease
LFGELPSLPEIMMAIPGVLMAFTFHEFAHAWVATLFGDETPRLQGRVTLNPLVHLDPIGTLLLLIGRFGWAKPVNINVSRLKPRVLGHIAVSLAGVAMNFLLAIGFYALYVGLVRHNLLGSYHNPVLNETLLTAADFNVVLVGFNIIPLPPLDGFHVARYLFPPSMDGVVNTLYRFGPILLILLFVSGYGSQFLEPIYGAIAHAVVSLVHLVL